MQIVCIAHAMSLRAYHKTIKSGICATSYFGFDLGVSSFNIIELYVFDFVIAIKERAKTIDIAKHTIKNPCWLNVFPIRTPRGKASCITLSTIPKTLPRFSLSREDTK